MVSIGSQFSTGDQDERVRVAIWQSGFSKCQRTTTAVACTRIEHTQNTITSKDFPAGCRMNGDAYGTTVFSCRECGWETSFQYDGASDDCYYYETRYYCIEPKAPKEPHLWETIQLQEWFITSKIDPRIQSKLRVYALDGPSLSAWM